MFGIRVEFNCKKCCKKQVHEKGITRIYHINNRNIDYVKLNCVSCGEIHYVSSYIIRGLTEEERVVHQSEVIDIEDAGVACF